MVSSTDRRRLAGICLRQFLRTRLPIPAEFELNLHGAFPEGGETPVLFAACDEAYFRQFAPALIRSSSENSPSARLHIHVYEPSASATGEILRLLADEPGRLSVTWDHAGLDPYPPGSPHHAVYYTSARFIRLSQLQERTAAPVFAVDCDSVVRGDLREFLEEASQYDLGVHRPRRRHAWHRYRPWRRVLAGAVFIAPNSAGRRFLAELAASMHRALASSPTHHVDQLALLYLLRLHRLSPRRLRVFSVPRSLIDWDFAEESLIWSGKGPRKYAEKFQEAVLVPPGDRDAAAIRTAP